MDGKSAFILRRRKEFIKLLLGDIKVPESLQNVIKELEEKSQQKSLLKKRKEKKNRPKRMWKYTNQQLNSSNLKLMPNLR